MCRRVQYTCAYSNQNLHKELLQRNTGTVTNVLLKVNYAIRADKIKKKLQEHFRKRPTQLHTSRELTKAQMRSNETIVKFNNRYTILLEESMEEFPETCESKTIIIAYTDALQHDIRRKLRSNIGKFKDKPHHPKAIKTLRDVMNQAVKLEWKQKFTNIQDTKIMDISPESSPQNSESESDGAEIDAIYSDRRYKSRQHRKWDNNRNQNSDNR